MALTGVAGVPHSKASTSKLHQPNTFSVGSDQVRPTKVRFSGPSGPSVDNTIGERAPHGIGNIRRARSSGTRICPVGPTIDAMACDRRIAGIGKEPAPIARMMSAITRIRLSDRASSRPARRETMVGRSADRRGPSDAINRSALNRSRCSSQISRNPGEPVSSPISISHLALKPSLPRAFSAHRLRGEIDRMLTLVVDDAAAIPAAVLFGQRPGREA